MSKLFLLFPFCLSITGCDNNPFASLFQPDIKICDLYEKPSMFADSLVYIHQLTVTKCSGLSSISCAEVTDGKCSINLFTTKPYVKNEIVDVEARYRVIFNYNGQSVSALVTDDFPLKPKNLLKFKYWKH